METLTETFSNLSTDVLHDIAFRLDYKDLINLCTASLRQNELLCQNDRFWKVKFQKEFGKSVKLGPIPEKTYYIIKSLEKEINKVSVQAKKNLQLMIPFKDVNDETKIRTYLSFLNYFAGVERDMNIPFQSVVFSSSKIDLSHYETLLVNFKKLEKTRVPDLMIVAPLYLKNFDDKIWDEYYKIFQTLTRTFIRNLISFYVKTSQTKDILIKNLQNPKYHYLNPVLFVLP